METGQEILTAHCVPKWNKQGEGKQQGYRFSLAALGWRCKAGTFTATNTKGWTLVGAKLPWELPAGTSPRGCQAFEFYFVLIKTDKKTNQRNQSNPHKVTGAFTVCAATNTAYSHRKIGYGARNTALLQPSICRRKTTSPSLAWNDMGFNFTEQAQHTRRDNRATALTKQQSSFM